MTQGAFWVMGWLVKKYSMDGKSLFSQDMQLLQQCLYITEQLLAKNAPALYAHLVEYPLPL